jgi:hypothetical protein
VSCNWSSGAAVQRTSGGIASQCNVGFTLFGILPDVLGSFSKSLEGDATIARQIVSLSLLTMAIRTHCSLMKFVEVRSR